MQHIEQLSQHALARRHEELRATYNQLLARGLSLDLTRGKPGPAQVALSDTLDGILAGDYLAADGSDTRNYGGLQGLPEARALFGTVLGVPAESMRVAGNSSLSLMYQVIDLALSEGLRGPPSAWGNDDVVRFLCPSPGYDRHFAICEHLGIEMLTVPMLDSGPDMDIVEALVRDDASIKGMWCVPRFSNPSGCVYSDDTVRRIARLGQLAAPHFLVMWDNAYAVHSLYDNAPQLAAIDDLSRDFGTQDTVFQFGSTSKVTFAGAGVAFFSSSADNLMAWDEHLAFQSIGPDKVNQLRHVRFLRDSAGLAAHMARHAEQIRPRFDCVLEVLERELGGTDMGTWTQPRGGYFISFETLPGLATEVVELAGAAGIKLTPAGASYPYGRDPNDSNIRLAPTFPSLTDLRTAAEAFALCVQLATVRGRLQ